MPDAAGRRDTTSHFATAVLGLPTTALPDVDDDAARALEAIGVSTVYDLARSAVFSVAGELVSRTGPIARPPADWVDSNYPADSDPKMWPVRTLRAVTNKAGATLHDALKVNNLGEFALWPPYRLARELLDLALGISAAVDGAAESSNFDETVPADLIPTNDLPTESVRYSTLVLGEVHEPSADGDPVGKSILTESQLDLSVALQKAAAGFQHVAEGALLTYEQSWHSLGLALGDVRKTIPLAAGEVVRVAQRDWTRRQAGTRSEAGSEQEQLANTTAHNRALNEVAAAVTAESQSGFTRSSAYSSSSQSGWASSSGLLGAIVGGVTSTGAEAANLTNAMTVTGSEGNRRVNSSMQQNIQESTQQNASAARSRRATVVEEISESDAATASTRILANYNHAHALNVIFYELIQVHRVTTRLCAVDKVLFIPLKMLDFTQADIGVDQAAALFPHAINLDIRELLQRYVKGPIAHFPTLPKGPMPEPRPADPIQPVMRPLVPTLADQLAAMRSRLPGLSGALQRADIEAARLPLVDTVKVAALQVTGVAPGAQIIATLADGSQEIAEVTDKGEAIFKREIDLSKNVNVTFNPKGVTVEQDAMITLPLLGSGTAGLSLPISGGFPSTIVDVRGRLSDGERQQLLLHLQRYRVRYNQALWAELDETAIAMLLAGYTYGDGAEAKPLLQWIDPKPIGFVGNYLVFRLRLDEPGAADQPKSVRKKWSEWRASHGLGPEQLKEDAATSILVPMPTDGLFAEAVLGRANCAEKIDISRFINWHEAPIPIQPPEIAPVSTAGQPQGMSLKSGEFPAPLINIVGPTSLPAPTLGQATVNAVANGNLFRDMSAAAATLGLAQGALQASATGAQSAGEQATDLQKQQLQIAGRLAEIAAQAATSYFGGGGGGLAETGLTAAGGLMNAGRRVDSAKAGTRPSSGLSLNGGAEVGASPDEVATGVGSSGTTVGPVAPSSREGADAASSGGTGYEERGFLAALGQRPESLADSKRAPSDGLREKAISDPQRPAGERSGISYELLEAWSLPAPTKRPDLMILTSAQSQVLSWLQFHKKLILDAEEVWKVDRRAIAGVIAWEALENVISPLLRPDGFGRSSGPGKVHYSTELLWGEGDPIAKQVEAAGYLPVLTMEGRRAKLATAAGAIEYIGAILSAIADIAAKSKHKFKMRGMPDILTNVYHGEDLNSWKSDLDRKPVGEAFRAGNPMAVWLAARLRYVEAAVGVPSPRLGQLGYIGPPKR